jgi:hypothetical protein
MTFKHYPKNYRKRSCLRKKNRYQLGQYRFQNQQFPQPSLRVYHRLQQAEKDRKLPSGSTIGQTWGALHKAWLAYCIAVNKNEGEKTLLYVSIIQRLQRELGIPVREFAEVDMFGSAIYKDESKLVVIDPYTNEMLQEAKEHEDDYGRKQLLKNEGFQA